MMHLTRRQVITTAVATATLPRLAHARTADEITWDDLIPPGVPYSEIIGEGEIDELNDTWRPIFDANATKLNPRLNGAYIKMPGFIIPIDLSTDGVTSFVLVPYVGACIHTPPPPPNQLVLCHNRDPLAQRRPLGGRLGDRANAARTAIHRSCRHRLCVKGRRNGGLCVVTSSYRSAKTHSGHRRFDLRTANFTGEGLH